MLYIPLSHIGIEPTANLAQTISNFVKAREERQQIQQNGGNEEDFPMLEMIQNFVQQRENHNHFVDDLRTNLQTMGFGMMNEDPNENLVMGNLNGNDDEEEEKEVDRLLDSILSNLIVQKYAAGDDTTPNHAIPQKAKVFKSFNVVHVELDEMASAAEKEREAPPARKRQKTSHLDAKEKDVTAVVDWTRLQHQNIMHILEYEEMIADQSALELIGYFGNDPKRCWHLMFRSVWILPKSIPNETVPWKLVLSQVAQLRLSIYAFDGMSSGFSDSVVYRLLENATERTMPRLITFSLAEQIESNEVIKRTAAFMLAHRNPFLKNKLYHADFHLCEQNAPFIGATLALFPRVQSITASTAMSDDVRMLATAGYGNRLQRLETTFNKLQHVLQIFTSAKGVISSVKHLVAHVEDDYDNLEIPWHQVRQASIRLRTLNMSNVSGKTIMHTFPCIPSLRSITISGFRLKSLCGIGQMKQLRSLTIELHDVENDIDYLEELGTLSDSLQHLSLHGNGRPSPLLLQVLHRLVRSNLEELTLGHVNELQLSDTIVEELTSGDLNLVKIRLDLNKKCTPKLLVPLIRNKRLREVTLSDVPFEWDVELTRRITKMGLLDSLVLNQDTVDLDRIYGGDINEEEEEEEVEAFGEIFDQ